MKMTPKLAMLAAAVLTATSHAQCLTDAEVDSLVGHYFSKTVAATPPALSEEDAACSRAKLNAQLTKRLGKVTGYKAGLTATVSYEGLAGAKPVSVTFM